MKNFAAKVMSLQERAERSTRRSDARAMPEKIPSHPPRIDLKIFQGKQKIAGYQ
jgi:hypothetical protein